MTETLPAASARTVGPDLPSDAAIELERAIVEAQAFYQTHLGMPSAEALLAVHELTETDRERALTAPAHGIGWLLLDRLTEHDPALADVTWQRILDTARDELGSGHRAARALEWQGDPWQRAQFLALRDGFVEEYQSRGGIEERLVDAAAQAFGEYLNWLTVLHLRTTVEVRREEWQASQRRNWEPPRVSDAEAVEQAAQMVERFHRLFVRSLKALKDWRRNPAPMLVQTQQVNVAEQQVNVAAIQTVSTADRHRRSS